MMFEYALFGHLPLNYKRAWESNDRNLVNHFARIDSDRCYPKNNGLEIYHMLMNCSIDSSIKNIRNSRTTEPDSRFIDWIERWAVDIDRYLDLLRPVLESPSTSIRDRCKHRQANDTPCNVRMNEEICTTYSQINDSVNRVVWLVPSIQREYRHEKILFSYLCQHWMDDFLRRYCTDLTNPWEDFD